METSSFTKHLLSAYCLERFPTVFRHWGGKVAVLPFCSVAVGGAVAVHVRLSKYTLGLAGACWDRVHTSRQVWRVLCQSFKARRSKPFKRCPRLTVLGVYHTISQLSRKIFSSLLTGTPYAPAVLPPSVCFAVVSFGMIECYHTNSQLSTTFFKISESFLTAC